MDNFRSKIKEAISELKNLKEKKVQIYHHNDSDGISSGAILKTIFEQSGFEIETLVSLEKPYPAILNSILSQKNKFIIFTDICGRIGGTLISNLNEKLSNSTNLIYILDHHVATASTNSKVYNLDCDLFGIKGDLDMSASSVCYTFGEELIGKEKMKPLSLLGIIGAIGDGFMINGKLSGQNKRIFEIAESLNLTKYNSELKCYVNKYNEPLKTICESIDTLGGVGYFSNGTKTALEYILLNKSTCSFQKGTNCSEIQKTVSNFTNLQKKLFSDLNSSLDSHILYSSDKEIMLIDVGDKFYPMGVKMIGVFLTQLAPTIKQCKYIFGSQNVPSKIPGFDKISLGSPMQKISGRVSPKMDTLIYHGKKMPLDYLMPNGVKNIEGGFADSCHTTAAAVTITDKKKESLKQFINQCEKINKGGQFVGVGAGYGKTIICGGDCGFLMWGVNGIVGALPFETVCVIEPVRKDSLSDIEKQQIKERGWICYDKRMEVEGYKKKKAVMQNKAIQMQIDYWKLNDKIKQNPISITFRGSLLAASGDGASAAHTVSTARALNHAFDLKHDDYEINHSGWIGEHAFHGKPSGVDNTVSTFGGLIDISFNVETQKSKFEKVKVKPIEIVLAHSGVHADTSSLLGICRNMKKKNEKLFNSQIDKIKKDVKNMRIAFEKSNWKELGKLMIDNHKTIIEMGLSHEKCEYLCNVGLKAGAFGAKVTGGGLGGYCLFLTPGKELQEKVRQKLEEAGGKAIFAVRLPSATE